MKNYGYEDGEAEEGGVEEIGDDGQGGDAGKAARHEQLGTVGQNALHAATGGIQQTRTPARVDVELLRDALGDIADGEDSDCVIRRAYIRECDESAYTPFGAGAALDMPCHPVDDKIESADKTEDSEDTAREHGDKDQFAHAHDALRGAADPAHEIVTAIEDAREAGENVSGRENNQDVDAAGRADKDCEVWQHFDEAESRELRAERFACFATEEDVHHRDDECRRHHHAHVIAELIAQLAALRLRSDNRRVADKTEVVAEERAAYDSRGDHRQGHLRTFGQPCGERHQRYDRTYRRTHTERRDAGRQEQARQGELRRQEIQRQIDHCTRRAHLFRARGKSSGEHEDPYHQQQVGVTCAAGEDGDPFFERKSASEGDREDRDDDKDKQHLVKSPFDSQTGVAHESCARRTAVEVITEFDLRADIEIRALEPPSDIIPQLRLGEQYERLLSAETLSPYIQETRETQAGRGAEIVAAPDKRELDRRPVLDAVVRIDDVFIEQFEIEDVLVISGVQAVVEAYERRVVDAVAAKVAHRVFVDTQAAVVLHLNAQVPGFRVLPEIKAPRDLRITHERRVLRIDGVDVIVEVHERKSRTPRVGVEKFDSGRHAIRTLVAAGRSAATEVIEDLQVRACRHAANEYRQQECRE